MSDRIFTKPVDFPQDDDVFGFTEIERPHDMVACFENGKMLTNIRTSFPPMIDDRIDFGHGRIYVVVGRTIVSPLMRRSYLRVELRAVEQSEEI